MKVDGTAYRTIWIDENDTLQVIDQRCLPHHFTIIPLATFAQACEAIRNMTVRGAGLIGATAGYAMWLAACEAPRHSETAFTQAMHQAAKVLQATRPTASNLARAVQLQLAALALEAELDHKIQTARQGAQAIADEDAAFCRRIGQHGLELILQIAARKRRDEPVRILTHCNAGWLAFVDHGSALSPVYAAHDAGVPVEVWVDETRPRNQGASLTAWELARHGVPYAVIADNAGGHLMQRGLVDMAIVGADRITRRGDVANKIGTYLKALAAKDNNVPFYVALPSSTFDFSMTDGILEIPIEERDPDEVRLIQGKILRGAKAGEVTVVSLCADGTPARNWAFDVTPARLISGLICERGVCAASEEGILQLFPERTILSEGVIKFSARHTDKRASEVFPQPFPSALLESRQVLYRHDLIGISPSGVGYGNLSQRMDQQCFIITGSGTGRVEDLDPTGFCLVQAFDVDANSVISCGPAQPSSESMTHGAIYAARPDTECVVHVHHHNLFKHLLRSGPFTPESAAYGTPELSRAVSALVATLPAIGLFATAGHADGVFAFGPTPAETLEKLLSALDSLLN